MGHSPQKLESAIPNPWQPIFRTILEELAPQVRHASIGLLKQELHSILFSQKGTFIFQGSEMGFSLEREVIQDEREYYYLAETIILVAQVLLHTRDCGELVAHTQEALGLPTSTIVEHLRELVKGIPEPSLEEKDLLGRTYQMLLPPTTRKRLAAFYTKPIITKFISVFVIDCAHSIFLDPACGTGAFLMAVFQRLHDIKPSAHPNTLIPNIKGIEISPIARFCAETNLRLRCGNLLSVPLSIQQGDAFHQKVNPSDKVDCLITNPPFTRGERLSSTYKAFLGSFFSDQFSPTGEVKNQFCSKNMPLHGYFLLDMDRFLRPGGRFSVVLPASSLQLKGLKGVRNYLLAHYILEFVITSEVESFSEDSDLKEIIMIGHSRERNVPTVGETTFITIITPLNLQNYVEFANFIELSVKNHGSGENIRVRHVKQTEMQEKIADWSVFFPPITSTGFEDQLSSSEKIGRICDLEGDSIEIFRGFRQDFAKYWAVPNVYWTLQESRPDYIRIQNAEKTKSQIILPANTWYKGLSRPEFYPRPLIETGQFFILKETQTPEREAGLAQYCAWVEQQFGKDHSNYAKFLQQLGQIGTRFTFGGRIAFCHRIDVTTSNVICYLSPHTVMLNQNWFSIRGLDPLVEELLVAWFNSTLFIATYMQHRRTQRGPYGQTAVREFRQYIVPLPDKLNSGEIHCIIDQFRAFDQSPELDFPISEQISRSLARETSRKEFDLVVLDALQVYPSQREKQREFLEKIYRSLVEKIEKVRQQGRRSGF